MSCCDHETSAPDWVIEHPQCLAVFEELGIDYSCGGKSLEFACQERGLDVKQVMARLQQLIELNRPKQ
jgi:iron-sulfur cluster repair protein YtfE (RIC family)